MKSNTTPLFFAASFSTLLLFIAPLHAQPKRSCNKFDCAYENAYSIFYKSSDKDKYKQALAQLNDAEKYARNDQNNKKKVQDLQDKIFREIRELRDSADANASENSALKSKNSALKIESDSLKKCNNNISAEVSRKNVFIFEYFVTLGKNLIYTLDYSEALEKMRVASQIDVPIEQKAKLLTEPIAELFYFFAESGRRPELARTAAELWLNLQPEDDLKKALQGCIDGRIKLTDILEERLFSKFDSCYYPQMVSVPLGNTGIFDMGSRPSEEVHPSERPLHTVKISPYQIASTPVTFYQFAIFSEAMGRSLASHTPYWGRFGDHPAVNVTWYEAIEYANWLNIKRGFSPFYDVQKSKNSDLNNLVKLDLLKWKVSPNPSVSKGFRLPTEAEWELAARGGVGAPRTLFAGGDTLAKVGWYWENSGDTILSGDWTLEKIRYNNGKAHAVREKSHNGIGVYDMSGNVYEWCWDWYDQGYYKECLQKGTVLNPTGPNSSDTGRVTRGGCWNLEEKDCRIAKRTRHDPDNPFNDVGFRVVFIP